MKSNNTKFVFLSCLASLGYPREEFYYEWDDYNKRQIRRSRWVTDWAPHSQMVQGTVVTVVYAGDKNLEAIATFAENMGWRSEDLCQPTQNDSKMISLFRASGNESWNNKNEIN